jgi:hypothetical protein
MKEAPLARVRSVLALLALSSLGACTGPDNDGIYSYGNDYFAYWTYDNDQVGFDEVTELGFSAAEAFAEVAGPFHETLVWETGESVDLELSLAVEDPPTAVIRTYGYTTDPGAALVLDVSFAFRTADGAFDEVWPVEIWFSAPDSGGIDYRFDPDDITGTHLLPPCDPPECSDPVGDVRSSFQGDGQTTGDLLFYGYPPRGGIEVDLGRAEWGPE